MKYRILNTNTDSRVITLEIYSLRKLPTLSELTALVPKGTSPVDLELDSLRYWRLCYDPVRTELKEYKLLEFAECYSEARLEIFSFLDREERKEKTLERASVALSTISILTIAYVFYKTLIENK